MLLSRAQGREKDKSLICHVKITHVSDQDGIRDFRNRLSETIGTEDRGSLETARLLAAMFQGMGDEAVVKDASDNASVTINHKGLRIVRGLTSEGRQDLIDCWIEIWRGVVQSHRTFMDLDVSQIDDGLEWSLSER